MSPRSGEGVDRFGGSVVDPTKNVEDLVKALEATLAQLRSADTLRFDDLRNAESKYQDAMRDAEVRRINELAALRVQYDVIIEGMRSTSLNTTSQLLATQLREVKTDLSDRTAKLEQFRWESGGKTGGQAQIISWVIAGAAVAFAVATFALK